MADKSRKEYWRRNVKLVVQCMIVWTVVTFVLSILLVHPLNSIPLGGYKLGFWFAQQGSMYVYVALIFFYSSRMGKLDKEFGVEEE